MLRMLYSSHLQSDVEDISIIETLESYVLWSPLYKLFTYIETCGLYCKFINPLSTHPMNDYGRTILEMFNIDPIARPSVIELYDGRFSSAMKTTKQFGYCGKKNSI